MESVKEFGKRLGSVEERLEWAEGTLIAMAIVDPLSRPADDDAKGTDVKEEVNLTENSRDGTIDYELKAEDLLSEDKEGQDSWFGLVRNSGVIGSILVMTAQGNIAKVNVDVIVNAANMHLRAEAGVCADIFKEAGDGLQQVCYDLAPVNVGEAVITDAFECRAHFIVHAVVPRCRGEGEGMERLLYDAYTNALKKAELVEACTVAFPCMCTGMEGFPVWAGAQVALRAIRDFRPQHICVVMLCNNDDAACEVYDRQVLAESHIPFYGVSKKRRLC